MHLGLIGGIGPAATDFYHRRLIAGFAARGHALDLTIVHADAPTLLANLAKGDVAAQVPIYYRLAERLKGAGADCVVITSMGGHFCVGAFAPVSPLPVVNILVELEAEIARRGLRRIGILGTRTVMESRAYGGIASAEIVPPPAGDLDTIHAAYAGMAAAGAVTEAQREVFMDAASQLLRDERVEAIMLGGTDLALVFGEDWNAFPLVDCAAIHVDALVRMATA